MDQKKLVDAFNEIVRVDHEVHQNSIKYNIDSYAEIFKNANSTRPIPNSLKVDEALLIMLQVVHSFKYSIDLYYDRIGDNDPAGMNEEIKNIISVH